MQKAAGVSKGDAGWVGASEGAGKEVLAAKLTAKAVACWERGGEPTAPLPGRNKGEVTCGCERAGSFSGVVSAAARLSARWPTSTWIDKVIGLLNGYCMLCTFVPWSWAAQGWARSEAATGAMAVRLVCRASRTKRLEDFCGRSEGFGPERYVRRLRVCGFCSEPSPLLGEAQVSLPICVPKLD